MPDNRRIESFSDAVFAIVVTIMVLEIHIPDGLAFGSNSVALMEFGALLAAYALSFVVIAIFWSNHHYLIFTLPSPDRATIWLNNNALFWVTLIPIVARFFGLNPTSPRAAAAYAFVIMTCTLSFSLLRRHAARISHNEFHRALHRRVFRRIWPAVGIYAAAIPLAFVDIRFAWACLLVLPAMFFLPVTRDTWKREESSPGE
jgi:Predicted integral membrane protein